MNTHDALNAIAERLRAIDDPRIRAESVHVYPPPHENAKPPQIRISRSRHQNSLATIYPTFVVSEALAEPSEWRFKTLGILLHRWTAEVQLFLAPQLVPQHECERLTYGWAALVAGALVASRSLDNTAYFIGDSGFDSRLMTVQAGYLSWYSDVDKEPASFWGIRFLIPVTQAHAMETGL
jgi:hypothetical protein